jgi:hypothetical protein
MSVGLVLDPVGQPLILLGQNQQLGAQFAIAKCFCDDAAFLRFEPEQLGAGGHGVLPFPTCMPGRI